jgi:hypothetical protein
MTYGKDPQLVTYPVAYTMLQYMIKVKELGAFDGPIGDMHLNPNLVALVKAIHTVLAGGAVEVVEKQPGDPDVIKNLDYMLAKATEDANVINKKSGYYVTISA